MTFNPCVVIPHYNHSDLLPNVIRNLQPFGLPIIIVDDGSSPEHLARAQKMCAQFDNITLKESPINGGKGHAVMTGLHLSYEKGFSHAIQIDGDGQHDIAALSTLIEKAKEQPGDVVSGYPVYGEDIPKVRKFGRYITHFWVWIETLSFDIKDSMCGFRVYPLKECVDLFSRSRMSPRMEFDTEVMVKLHWSGVGFHQLPVRVHYPEEGRSHFRYVKDNVRLIWAHTKMVLGMIVRAPKWLIFGRQRKTEAHWMKQPEAGTVFGLKLLLGIYSSLGRGILDFILLFVAGYYYVFNRAAREASEDYIARYKKYFGIDAKPGISSFRHIYEFAISLLDKVAAWRGDIPLSQVSFPNIEIFKTLLDSKQGAVFLTSHFGNLEICRSWAREFKEVKLNAVFYIRNAQKFNSVLKTMSPDVSMNVFSPHEMNMETGMLFKQKVDAGEWIFVMADRLLSGTQSRTVKASLLGEDVHLPMGPFAMAESLQVPVYSMHCYRADGKFHVVVEPLDKADPSAKRADRFAILGRSYIKQLENLIRIAPLQWFNFFKFWTHNG